VKIFLHRLAMQFGMTVGRLLRELDEFGGMRALLDWQAYNRIEPFGYDAENWRAGMLASTIVNTTPRGPGAKAAKPSDFYPVTDNADGLTDRQKKEIERRGLARKKGEAPPPRPAPKAKPKPTVGKVKAKAMSARERRK
jgi:hypothetical protein